MIAREDLDSAKHLFSKSFTTTLFHIQQCAEKSLKAYLVSESRGVIKTHDLVELINICLELNKQFEIIRPLAAVLTPFQTSGRYPDNSFKKPSQEKTLGHIEQSEYVFDFVRHQIDGVGQR